MDRPLSVQKWLKQKQSLCSAFALNPSMAILILGSNMLWSLWLALTKLWSLTQQEFQPGWKILLTPVIHFVPVQIPGTVSVAVSQVNTTPSRGDGNSQPVIQCFHQYPSGQPVAQGLPAADPWLPFPTILMSTFVLTRDVLRFLLETASQRSILDYARCSLKGWCVNVK